jgi:hypothetical protein
MPLHSDREVTMTVTVTVTVTVTGAPPGCTVTARGEQRCGAAARRDQGRGRHGSPRGEGAGGG